MIFSQEMQSLKKDLSIAEDDLLRANEENAMMRNNIKKLQEKLQEKLQAAESYPVSPPPKSSPIKFIIKKKPEPETKTETDKNSNKTMIEIKKLVKQLEDAEKEAAHKKNYTKFGTSMISLMKETGEVENQTDTGKTINMIWELTEALSAKKSEVRKNDRKEFSDAVMELVE